MEPMGTTLDHPDTIPTLESLAGGPVVHDGFVPHSSFPETAPDTLYGSTSMFGATNRYYLQPPIQSDDPYDALSAYGPDSDYRSLAQQFQMQYGTPSDRQGFFDSNENIMFDGNRTLDAETQGRPMANDFLDLELIRRSRDMAREGDVTNDEATDAEFEDVLEQLDEREYSPDLEAPTRGRGRGGRGRTRGGSRGRGRGRGGWKWALKGTEHDPALEKKQKRGPGRPPGKKTRGAKPGSQQIRKRQRAADPGPEFHRLQQRATDAFVNGDLDTAMDMARQAVLINPEIFAAHSLLSDILSAKGQEKDALAALITGAAFKKDSDLWVMIADQTLMLAGGYRTKVDIEQALYCLGHAQNLNRTDCDIRQQKRDLHLELGHEHRARAECVMLAQLRPDDLDNIKVFAELAIAAKEPGELNKARQMYEKAFELYKDKDTFGGPEVQWTHLNQYLDTISRPEYALGQLKRLSRWFLGRKDEVFWEHYDQDDREYDTSHERRYFVGEFQQGLASRDPSLYGDGLPLDIRVKAGILRLDMGQVYHEEALAHFEHIYALKDDIVDFYDLFYLIADALRQASVLEAAVRFYEPIMVLESELTDEFWLNLATCHRLLENYTEAETCYHAVMDLDPEHQRARIELARMYSDDMGEKSKALVITRELIALGKKDIIRREKLPMPEQPQKESARRKRGLYNTKRRQLANGELLVDESGVDDFDETRGPVPESNTVRARQILSQQDARQLRVSQAMQRPLVAAAPTNPVPGATSHGPMDPNLDFDLLGLTAGADEDDSEWEGGSDSGSESPDDFFPAGEGSYSTWDAYAGQELAEGLDRPAKSKSSSRQKTDRRGGSRGGKSGSNKKISDKRYAEYLKKNDEQSEWQEAQAARVLEAFNIVKELWHVLADEDADDSQLFAWMDAAKIMYSEFRTVRAFYPNRDRFKPPKGWRIRNRDTKMIREMEAFSKQLLEEGAREPDENDDESDDEGDTRALGRGPPPVDVYAPTDFHGIHFAMWHRIFVDLALVNARQSDQISSYEILENGLFNANIFFHDKELLNTTQAASICCALIFNDSQRLVKTARWFTMRSDLRAGSSYQLLSAVARLVFGENNWFNAGPTQKFALRSVKSQDYAALPADVRQKYDFSMPIAQLKRRLQYPDDGLDPGLLMNYGHMVSVANHTSSALPYYFRALALRPNDPTINLSIATMYISNAMKRQTQNRQFEIHQGLSFLYRYYDLRTSHTSRSLERQEAEYNVARMWHGIGLTHLAIPGYEKVLALGEAVDAEMLGVRAMREKSREERGAMGMGGEAGEEEEPTMENFAPEAAYALQTLYSFAGNHGAARKVTEGFLVL